VDTRFTPERIWAQLSGDDLERLKRGLRRTCELFFHGTPAPSRALIATRKRWGLSRDTYERSIDAISSFDEIQISSTHPQGGNCLSGDGRGVVRPDFRVHHTQGLYVVDASVFPTSLGVNPQWTVMAVADVAAGYIGSAR
jgi:choline dehydrogenase-like flavoprotein